MTGFLPVFFSQLPQDPIVYSQRIDDKSSDRILRSNLETFLGGDVVSYIFIQRSYFPGGFFSVFFFLPPDDRSLEREGGD